MRLQEKLQVIRQRLMLHRHALLARYRDELARADEQLDTVEIEGVERSTELWDVHMLSLLGTADAAALARTVDAIRRIDSGRYGICVECAREIDEARLGALPSAATCIECAFGNDVEVEPLWRATGS